MKVAKWGNSLAVRLPAELVQDMALREGDEIGLAKIGPGELGVHRRRSIEDILKSLDRFRGMRPDDYKFDREEANARR